MKQRTDNTIRAGYITAFVLLFFSYLLTFYTARRLQDQSTLINYTNSVISNLDYLLSGIKDAQRGTRGYFILGDESFLNPYYASIHTVDSVHTVLKGLLKSEKFAADNKLQYDRLEKINNEVQKEFADIKNVIDTFKQHHLIITGKIKQAEYADQHFIDTIDAHIKVMQQEENRVMGKRIDHLDGFIRTMQVINVTSLIIALLLSIYSITTYNKENTAKKLADEKAEDYRRQLEERIEELRKNNEELVRLRSIEKFAATGRIARTIAHEVRNPLTNITLATEQLQMEMPDNEETNLLVEMINRNTNRINQLITDLLNSTKFAQLVFKKSSVNKLLNDTAELAEDRLELKGVQLFKNYDDKLPEVEVDEEKLKIAFLNIILNAIEAMEEGKGVLTITTAHVKDKCVITIGDNGSGISEEHMHRLFEPYFTNKMKGSGLGLTNTQNIIYSHKGNIRAESKQGVGTSFIVELNCV